MHQLAQQFIRTARELFFFSFDYHKHKYGRRNHLARLDGTTTELGEESTHAKQSHHADIATRPGEMPLCQVPGTSLRETAAAGALSHLGPAVWRGLLPPRRQQPPLRQPSPPRPQLVVGCHSMVPGWLSQPLSPHTEVPSAAAGKR